MARISLFSSLAFTALLLTPAALCAQASGNMETGSLIKNRSAGGYGTDPKDVRSISRIFAECTLRRGRGSVERYLAAPIGGSEEAKLRKRILVDDCLGAGSLTLPLEVIRGALFEQLYLADFKTAPVADLSAVPAIDYTIGYAQPIAPQASNGIALARFGDCVARTDPGNARSMLVNVPDSRGETAALQALKSRLGGCIPQGQKISFSRSVLRASIAEGLYRLARAATGAPWGAS
ncbi:MAG TPA: hypothetical protein VGC35_06445 [Allosphingosinicella sp.]|jgi:hypothetical protein